MKNSVIKVIKIYFALDRITTIVNSAIKVIKIYPTSDRMTKIRMKTIKIHLTLGGLIEIENFAILKAIKST